MGTKTLALVVVGFLCTASAGFAQEDELQTIVWTSWDSSGDGSWVKMKMTMETGGGSMTTETTKTRAAKEGDTINLSVKTKTFMKGVNIPARTTKEQVKKPVGNQGGLNQKCKKCQKAYREHGTFKTTKDVKMTVDGKELSCILMESDFKDCESDKSFKSKTWFCKDVPGGTVKMQAGKMVMLCVGFEKK